MTQQKKIWTGVLALSPIAVIILFAIIMMIFTISLASGQLEENSSNIFMFSGTIVAISFLTVGLATASWIYFLVNAVNNTTLTSDQRLMWILIMVFTHNLGATIDWYMHFIKTPENNNNTIVNS